MKYDLLATDYQSMAWLISILIKILESKRRQKMFQIEFQKPSSWLVHLFTDLSPFSLMNKCWHADIPYNAHIAYTHSVPTMPTMPAILAALPPVLKSNLITFVIIKNFSNILKKHFIEF